MTFGLDGKPTAQNLDSKLNTQTFIGIASNGAGPENAAAKLRATFTMAAFVALAIHAIVVETYLWLTPAEHYRLRCVSYERQVERGWRKRGEVRDSGLTGASVGDAPKWWSVPQDDFDAEMKIVGHGYETSTH